MGDFVQDIRYTLRLLGRAPAFAAVAVATLALGIGANTSIFAVVNGVLLKPLPFADADRLMLVHLLVPEREHPGVFRESVWSYPKYRTFEGAQDVFEEVAFFAGRDIDLSGDGDPQRVHGEVVTERYFSVLGITPFMGRAFSVDEVRKAGTPAAIMIGHGLWMRRFGADQNVVGRTIHVNAAAYTIIGVLPRDFRGLTGNADVWVPLAAFEPSQLDQAQSHSYTIVARRRRDIPEATAAAAVQVIGNQVDAAHPRKDIGMAGWTARANSLYASRVDTDIRRAAFVLLGAAGFVLLIACVNLTKLVAAKALARRREVAVRVAIGADRGRIVRQFLTEGLLLSGLGAIGGLLVASGLMWAATVLLPESDVFFRSAVAPGRPRIAGAAGLTRISASMIRLDGMTLLFTGAVALLTAMLVSLLPAMQASLLRPVDALKAGAEVSVPRRWIDSRAMLVTAQIALALILLSGAGLMIRSAQRLSATGIGVNASGLFTVRVDLPTATYNNERGQAFYAQLLEHMRSLAGVESAALGLCAPVSGGCNGTIMWFPPAREPRRDGTDPLVGIHWVTPEFLPTMGIKLLRGRNFTEHDRVGQPKVMLVSEAAARAIWPKQDPVGKRAFAGQGGFGGGDAAEVIGVVSDVRYRAIETAPTPDVYVPLAQSYQSRMRLFVRTSLASSTLAPAVAREVHLLDPNLPLSEIKTMDERLADAMAHASGGVAAVVVCGPGGAADGHGNLRSDGAGCPTTDGGDRHPHGARRAGAGRPAAGARPRGGRYVRGNSHRRGGGSCTHAADDGAVIRNKAGRSRDIRLRRAAAWCSCTRGRVHSGTQGYEGGCHRRAARRVKTEDVRLLGTNPRPCGDSPDSSIAPLRPPSVPRMLQKVIAAVEAQMRGRDEHHAGGRPHEVAMRLGAATLVCGFPARCASHEGLFSWSSL